MLENNLNRIKQLLSDKRLAPKEEQRHLLTLLLRLRQICDHPFLTLTLNQKHSLGQEAETEDRQAFLKSFEKNMTGIDSEEYMKQIKNNIESGLGHECSICLQDSTELNIFSNNLVITSCGHFFCDSCLTKSKLQSPLCPFCRKEYEHRAVPMACEQVPKSLSDLRTPSTKITRLLIDLKQIPGDEKIIVVSQWTGMLVS